MDSVTRTLASMCHAIGLTRWAARGVGAWHRLTGREVFTILIYHRVVDRLEPFAIDSIDARAFEAQMRYLRAAYKLLTVEDIVAAVESNGRLPSDCVAVTFDDGYRDNYEVALPILRRHGVPATVYLAVDHVGTGKPLWFDEVLAMFRDAAVPRLDYFPEREALPLDAPARKLAACRTVLEDLKRRPRADREERLDRLAAALEISRSRPRPDLMLGWDQVREMAAAGVRFGGHTASHTVLSNLGEAEYEHELAGARRWIESETGTAVTTFAYPNGKPADYDAAGIAALKAAGFAAALTTSPIANRAGGDLFALGRLSPVRWSASALSLRLAAHAAGLYPRGADGGGET